MLLMVLTNVRVRVITFIPHTIHVFQMLNVLPFDALKKHATDLEILNEE
jgi:hypothetical protein